MLSITEHHVKQNKQYLKETYVIVKARKYIWEFHIANVKKKMILNY